MRRYRRGNFSLLAQLDLVATADRCPPSPLSPLTRTLAASTSPAALDGLITLAPERLEFYRTRGIVHTFKQNYPEAIRNFTTGIAQSKAARKAKEHAEAVATGKANKRKTSKPANKSSAARLAEAAAAAVSWDAADAGTANGGAGGGAGGGASVPAGEVAEGIGHEPGDDLERQLLFHRAMAHFHFACKTLEDAVLDVEEVHKPEGGLSNEGGELTLRNLGILLKDESAGLYGNAPPKKQAKYRQGLNEPNIKDKINSLLRKSLRDMERYLSYFAIWEAPPGSILEEEHKHQVPRPSDRPLTFRGRRLIHHRSLTGRTRSHDPRRPEVNANEVQEEPALLTTYHPLLIEAHFCVLLSLLLLGDFAALVPAYYKVVRLMDYLAGYPVFLEARSLNMSQFAEVLERLAISWLGPREAAGARAPMGTEKDAAREGDLPALHHLLGFYTEDFIKAVVERCERDSESDRKEEEAREMRRHFDGGRRLLENGGEAEPKESWKEYRDREEEERRKVDPSCKPLPEGSPCHRCADLVLCPRHRCRRDVQHGPGRGSTGLARCRRPPREGSGRARARRWRRPNPSRLVPPRQLRRLRLDRQRLRRGRQCQRLERPDRLTLGLHRDGPVRLGRGFRLEFELGIERDLSVDDVRAGRRAEQPDGGRQRGGAGRQCKREWEGQGQGKGGGGIGCVPELSFATF